jgi:hypothetical protein
MQLRILKGLALAFIGCGIPLTPMAQANTGEIAHAVTNARGTFVHVAGWATLSAEEGGEVSLWAAQPSRRGCRPYVEGYLAGYEANRIWKMGLWRYATLEGFPEGTFPINNVRVRLRYGSGRPCIYLTVEREYEKCPSGWPWSLREYCPKEYIPWKETLAMEELTYANAL